MRPSIAYPRRLVEFQKRQQRATCLHWPNGATAPTTFDVEIRGVSAPTPALVKEDEATERQLPPLDHAQREVSK